MATVSCQAKVGKRRFPLLRAGSDLKKKNVPAIFSRPYEYEIVCAMADFPTPAGPYSQKIRSGVLGLSIQLRICFNTLSRVPGWHWRSGFWADESWRASKETNSFRESNPVISISRSSIKQPVPKHTKYPTVNIHLLAKVIELR